MFSSCTISLSWPGLPCSPPCWSSCQPVSLSWATAGASAGLSPQPVSSACRHSPPSWCPWSPGGGQVLLWTEAPHKDWRLCTSKTWCDLWDQMELLSEWLPRLPLNYIEVCERVLGESMDDYNWRWVRERTRPDWAGMSGLVGTEGSEGQHLSIFSSSSAAVGECHVKGHSAVNSDEWDSLTRPKLTWGKQESSPCPLWSHREKDPQPPSFSSPEAGCWRASSCWAAMWSPMTTGKFIEYFNSAPYQQCQNNFTLSNYLLKL